jgi:hypothetical protein
MAKFIPIHEAKVFLNTTSEIIYVTACQFKKKTGNYPIWYKTDKRKSSIDIDYLNELRDKEFNLYNKSTDLYYFIIEDMKKKESELSRILAEGSEIYSTTSSWRSFMRSNLFTEPSIKFYDRVTRLQEFYRIASKLKDEFLCKEKTI